MLKNVITKRFLEKNTSKSLISHVSRTFNINVDIKLSMLRNRHEFNLHKPESLVFTKSF